MMGVVMSDISPIKPLDVSPRLTIGERVNITLELDQRNQPGDLADIVWKQTVVCDETNPFDNLCNIPGDVQV